MSMYSIVQVDSTKHEMDFLNLPSIINSRNPHFVRHLNHDIQSVFAPNHLETLNAQMRRWIVYEKNSNIPVGKIAAFFSEQQGNGIGFFDSIECIEVSNLLFDQAVAWLKDYGIKNKPIWAPVNLGQRDIFWGLLVEGFKSPSYRENYNPPYYESLFKAYGFVKEMEQITYSINPQNTDQAMLSRIASRALRNENVSIRPLNKHNIDMLAEDFITIYNQAWSQHDHFKPLNKREMLPKIKQMLPIAPASLNALAYVGGVPAGFFINIFEINSLLRGNNGTMSWWHKFKIVLMPKSFKKLRGIVFGVVPKYQKIGLESAMIHFVNKQLLGPKWNHIKEVEISWIGDFNPKMISLIKKLGATESKRHHTFKLNLIETID